MRGLFRFLQIVICVVCAGFSSIAADPDSAVREWPRVFYRDGVTNTIYQPQLDSWDYFKFVATSAVAIQPKGKKQPTYGTLEFTARTRVDRAERQVFFEN